MPRLKFLRILLASIITVPYLLNNAHSEPEPAEILLGERLFLETRFAHSFFRFTQQGGDYNSAIDVGDPQLDKTYRFFGMPPYQIPFADSPFRGGTFSCRSCHMVDEHAAQQELGMRAYADFASRSPVSLREDQQTVTVRNSPILITTATSDNKQYNLLHADGEFASLKDLIIATLSERNFGWLPAEANIAKTHICAVIQQDDGSNELAKEFGGLSYQEALSGKLANAKAFPEEYLIDAEYRADISKSSCDETLTAIALLLEAYVIDLQFAQDPVALSPYDQFLRTNKLPLDARADESDKQYSARLLAQISTLEKNKTLRLITRNEHNEDEKFRFHDQLYKFGDIELQGMKIFLQQTANANNSHANCVACHPAPHFTDFKFHNIGISQLEYEAIHGANAFNRLPIPSLEARRKHADTYLPASSRNPNRQGVFRRVTNEKETLYTDLGAWNILFNTDYPNPQDKLYAVFCDTSEPCKSNDVALQRAVATFKTPTLRNLGHSAPYMHNGQLNDLHAIMAYYVNASVSAQNGQMRNADAELAAMKLTLSDIEPLVAFLISLYEDYE